MKNYNIVFTGQENEKFNLLENQRIKESCMSVYSYLLKLNMEKNDRLGESSLNNSNEITISMRDFIRRYKKHHPILSIRTLKNRIDTLIKLGLITVQKIKNSFAYSFARYKSTHEVNKKVNNTKIPESIENANPNVGDSKPKYLNINYYYDYDSNSLNTLHNENDFDKEKYIATQEKCSWEFACDIMTDAFIKLRVNKFIKARVLEKITKYYSKITRKHAETYIIKTIKNAIIDNENSFKQRVLNNTYSTFNDFPQRRYDGSDGEFTLKDFENKALDYV